MRAITEQDLPLHLTIDEVGEHILRCRRSKAFEYVSDDANEFPLPVLVSGRNRLWHRDEVLAWRDSRRPTTRNPRGTAVLPAPEPSAADVDPLAGFTDVADRGQAAA